MMRGTPRTFVGPVVFLLEETVPAHVAVSVCAAVERLPGISSCRLDAGAGTVVVTAHGPVDRNAVVATLERLGCRFRA